MTALGYGDIVICVAILDDEMVPGRILTVVHASEEYVYFKERPNVGYRIGADFLVAVRRPWNAWSDEAAWEKRAKLEAAGQVRELLLCAFKYRREHIQRMADDLSASQVTPRVPRPSGAGRAEAVRGLLTAMRYIDKT